MTNAMRQERELSKVAPEHTQLSSEPAPPTPVMQTEELEKVPEQMRALFASGGEELHMDAGMVGAQLHGALEHDEPVCSTFAEARQAIAPGFGCDPSELVITHSTTDALSRIIAGLDLNEGDEVLTTNHEHYGSLAPLAICRDRRGIRIRKIMLPIGDNQCAEDYVKLFAAAFNKRTKVLLFSAPTATLGAMLPVAALARLAQHHGCTSVVDGAHIPGMLHYSFEESGVDFLAGSGTKWQCGPAGTGLLYIRNRVLPCFNPRPLPVFWPVVSIWYPLEGGLPARTTNDAPTYDIAEYLQTCGSSSLLRIQGFQRACETWERIGRAQIERYLLGLSSYLKQQITAAWGSQALYSPWSDKRLASAITSFNPFENSAAADDESRFKLLVERLEAEHKIVLRYSRFTHGDPPEPRFAIRIAVRPFHHRCDVDKLITAMTKLCAEIDG